MLTYAKTHRCQGSLQKKKSIRFHIKDSDFDFRETGWYLGSAETDYDYDVTYLSVFGSISYCPYCGEKLKEAEK